jgi:hypothetical protein
VQFRALPIIDFEDATLDFEQLQTLDVLNLTAETVLQLVVSGKLALAVGSQSFNGSATNAIGLTVVTGLGRTVSAFLPISGATTGGDWFIGSFANSGTPGTITCTAFRPFGNFAAGTNNYSFNWIAIG